MKLYKVSQNINNGYDVYDAMVVSAVDESDARHIHPSRYVTHYRDNKWFGTYADGSEYETEKTYSSWVKGVLIDGLKVEYLGETELPRGVILASFNAG